MGIKRDKGSLRGSRGLWVEWNEWILRVLLEVAHTDENAPVEHVERKEDDRKKCPERVRKGFSKSQI